MATFPTSGIHAATRSFEHGPPHVAELHVLPACESSFGTLKYSGYLKLSESLKGALQTFRPFRSPNDKD